MAFRLFVLGTLLTAAAAANPLTVTVSGVGSGLFAGKIFIATPFTVTLTSDTDAIVKPPCCDTVNLPSGSPATITIQGETATIVDNQTVFVSPNSYIIGLAHFNDGHLLDLTNLAVSGYRFGTSVGPEGQFET